MKPNMTLVSVEEYLHGEANAHFKSEYMAGETTPLHRQTDTLGKVTNMAGAQPPHNRLVSRLLALLEFCLEDTGCLVFASDQLVHIPACEKFTYPDITVVCNEPEYTTSPGGLQALRNPAIIIEVLSKSTGDYDRGEKFECYQTLRSLQQYVLVSSFSKPKMETYTRKTAKDWDYHIETETEKSIAIGGCEFLLGSVYKKVALQK